MPKWLQGNASKWAAGIGAAAFAIVVAGLVIFDAPPARQMAVYKTPWCGCCTAWVEEMRRSGFRVTVHDVEDLGPIKAEAGIGDHLQSCHTAFVDGYVFEGHVPAAEIVRFLTEAPEARGLAVPGMPLGSPGMDFDDETEPYDVLLVDARGETSVFAAY